MTVDFTFNDFTAGQISKKLFGRADLAKYYKGAEQITNFIPLVQGGVTRRPGTKFVNEAKTDDSSIRLYKFKSSRDVSFMLEFGNNYIRFHKQNLSTVESGGSPYEVVTTYTSSQVDDLVFAQSNDYIFITHDAHPPRRLFRTTDTNWTLELHPYIDGPFLEKNTDKGVKLTPSASSGSITITSTESLFVGSDVGRLVRIRHKGIPGSAEITAYNSATSVDATVQNGYEFNDVTASKHWRLGEWSSSRGYPAFIAFHEERQITASGSSFWGTVVNDFDTYSPTLEPEPQPIQVSETFDTFGASTGTSRTESSEDDIWITTDEAGFNYTLATNTAHNISWVASARDLIIGTDEGEFIVNSGSAKEPLTASNAQAIMRTSNGGKRTTPVTVDNKVIFVERSGRKVLELGSDGSGFSYGTKDLTIMADDLTLKGGGVKQLAYTKSPVPIVWALSETGQLYGCTYSPSENVTAWFECAFTGGDDPRVHSIGSIPSDFGDYDQLWIMIRRKINGVNKMMIEVLDEFIFDDERQGDVVSQIRANYVDCGVELYSPGSTTLSGLDHLEGESVVVYADGAVKANQTVSSGSITVDEIYTNVKVGLPYTSTLRTVPLDTLNGVTTIRAKKKRASHVAMNLYRSVGGKVGRDASNLYVIPYRSDQTLMDSAPPLFTGLLEEPVDIGSSPTQQLTIVQDQPLPLTISSLIFKSIVEQ